MIDGYQNAGTAPRHDRSRTLERLCIAIPTYRRTSALRRLLEALGGVSLPVGCRIEVVVMDNDSPPSAHEVVDDVRRHFSLPLTYVHIPEAGLSAVRNWALEHALRTSDLLVMIDDDEIPRPSWLVELVRVQRETGADAVFGPVPCIVPHCAPRWLQSGRFYEAPTPADCIAVTEGYSGNCLMLVRSIDRFAVRFDLELNFAGGEDRLFFCEWLRHGARLVSAAYAIADEVVGLERFCSGYILRSNFRRGNTLAFCDQRLDRRRQKLVVRAVKAFIRIGRGVLQFMPLALTRGRTGMLVALCDLAWGLGSLAGLFGYTYQAYRRRSA